MIKYLFDGLPPNVVTYIKIHLRTLYTSGLFDIQEREDLIQELVLFYFEFQKKRLGPIPDNILFMALKSKALHLGRTRLREMQSGFLTTRSLNSMLEDEGIEPVSDFSLHNLENTILLREVRQYLSDKQNKFIDLILSGETAEDARKKLHISHTVFKDIQERISYGRNKKQKKIKKIGGFFED